MMLFIVHIQISWRFCTTVFAIFSRVAWIRVSRSYLDRWSRSESLFAARCAGTLSLPILQQRSTATSHMLAKMLLVTRTLIVVIRSEFSGPRLALLQMLRLLCTLRSASVRG